MGLDMYLTISEYVTRTKRDNLMGDAPASNPLFEELVNRRPSWVDKSGFHGISIDYPAGYWRKANGIHGWFVNNVQDGRDECQKSYVSPEQLRELRDACELVLWTHNKADGASLPDDVFDDRSVQTVAEEVGLATKSGFFFGGTEYDEYYLEDLRYTAKLITRLEVAGVFDNAWVDVFYQASW